MNYTFASATILLILITDPIGNIPIFANALARGARAATLGDLAGGADRLCAAADLHVCRRRLLRVMNLSELSLQIGGGVILFLIALRMIFPPPESDAHRGMREPLIVPLAIPAIAGPSALATVLLLVSQAPERRMEWIAALCVTMRSAPWCWCWPNGFSACWASAGGGLERLMGLVLVAVSIEMMLRGVKTFAGQMAERLSLQRRPTPAVRRLQRHDFLLDRAKHALARRGPSSRCGWCRQTS